MKRFYEFQCQNQRLIKSLFEFSYKLTTQCSKLSYNQKGGGLINKGRLY